MTSSPGPPKTGESLPGPASITLSPAQSVQRSSPSPRSALMICGTGHAAASPPRPEYVSTQPPLGVMCANDSPIVRHGVATGEQLVLYGLTPAITELYSPDLAVTITA